MKKAYPILIVQSGEEFSVYAPDMGIYTDGKSVEDAIAKARDAMGFVGVCVEDDNASLPQPSTQEEAMNKAKQDAETVGYSKGIVTLVDVDFVEYRKQVDNKTVRRNVTLPNWLNLEAEKSGINVSGVLRDALINIFGVSKANSGK